MVRACCVSRKFSPKLPYSDGRHDSRCAHATVSTGQPLPAYSRQLVSLPFITSCIREARVPPAEAGLCLESRLRLHVRALPKQRRDRIEITAANGFRSQLVAALSVHPACLPTLADPRAPGHPWATTVALHEAYASNRHRNKPPSAYASARCERLRRRIRGALLSFACPC